MVRLAACFATLACGVAVANPSDLSCSDRLARTLDAMQDRPLLKEEHATALMWLRMAAAEAAAIGDEEGCLSDVAIVENLLGVSSDRSR